jgi:hypothetical protein
MLTCMAGASPARGYESDRESMLSRLRTTVIAGAVMALAVTALGAPAAASHGKGTIGIINGDPDRRVDMCLRGKEIKSRAPYGGRAYRSIPAGGAWIKIFKPDSRKCKGKLLGKKFIDLLHDGDWTVVFNKPFPKFVMFDNIGLGLIPPIGAPHAGSALAWRHAADLGLVEFLYNQLGPDIPITPVAHADWEEGDSFASPVGPGASFRLAATRPHKTKRIAKTKFILFEPGHRYEWYLLGTNHKNAKFIVWNRAMSLPLP